MGLTSNAPAVSVVMAVYNGERYLRRALDSVCAQTLHDIEILCVDDGSTDHSVAILQSYAEKDARIRILHHREQTDGAAAARNMGIAAATGEYLSILDADDFFEPEMLETAYRQGKAERADIVMFDAWGYDDTTKSRYIIGYLLSKDHVPQEQTFCPRDHADELFQMRGGEAWNALFLRSFVERQQLRFESFHYFDDFCFVYPAMACAERITTCRERLMSYCYDHVGSQTHARTRWLKDAFLPLLKFRQILEEKGLFRLYQRSFAERALGMLLYWLRCLDDASAFLSLYETLKQGMFKELGILDVPEDRLSEGLVRDMKNVLRLSPVEYLIQAYQKKETSELQQFVARYADAMDAPLAIYGAGDHGRYVFEELALKARYPIATWADREYERLGYPIEPPARLLEVVFSFVLVTIVDEKVYHSVRRDLVQMGVPEEKILWVGPY